MTRPATLARFEVSGEILSEDTIALLATAVCRLLGSELEEDDFTAAYDLLVERWQAIRADVAGYDTTELRRRWQLEVLQLLGYEPEALRAHTRYSDGRYTIALTHRDGDMPFWLLSYGQKFDEKLEQGRRKRSPHEQFQEYLDAAEDEWGILFNGKTIRLLHDYHKTLTRNYVEADLESIFDALDVDAFRAVYRIFSSPKFAKGAGGKRPIELLRDASRQDGATVGKELRVQVRKAIEVLGNGFLVADSDGRLLDELRKNPAAISAFYQALLRIIYRLLFLLYIGYRPGWVPGENREIWAESYSIIKLRELAEEAAVLRATGEDAWEGLKVVAGIIREGNDFFRIHPYGGELFDDAKLWLLRDAALPNADLLQAIRLLTLFERGKQPYRVNFSTLDIEAMGSVYEGLLDVTAYITPDGRFAFAEGTERKLTGSYYTPKELVAELIESALVPVIIDRLEGKVDTVEREQALLSIKVVDPACGSGAFLVQALDKLTEALVRIRFGDEEPSDLDVREARRDVVRHCIHGVDLNPLAVDLCRFVLWLNVAHPNFPLSYLEPLIKQGNSLVGVPLPSQVAARKAELDAERQRLRDLGDLRAAARVTYTGWPDSIPDDAYKPVTGDDKVAATAARKRNQESMTGQLAWDVTEIAGAPIQLAERYTHLRVASDKDIDAVHYAEILYAEYLVSDDYRRQRQAADLWCAAFVWNYIADQVHAPTTLWLRHVLQGDYPLASDLVTRVTHLASTVRFFHWHLEFPDVFQAGGFDCVLGNPPWERIKLQEQEFFATRDAAIAEAANKAERQRKIDDLIRINPILAQEFEDAKHASEAESKFVRLSGRYSLTDVGDVNTYALFAELSLRLNSDGGQAGIICPTGIATDNTTKEFFSYLVNNNRLYSLVGFENESFIFPNVHHSFKFCALTISGSKVALQEADFIFLCRYFQDANDQRRHFRLTASDIELLNPNTRTCPIFRTLQDAELAKSIYRTVPIIADESTRINPWGIYYLRLIHLGDHVEYLRDRQQLAISEDQQFYNARVVTDDRYIALYEARQIWLYNHRYSTYAGVSQKEAFEGKSSVSSNIELSKSDYTITPRYWVTESFFEDLLQKYNYTKHWFVAYRDVTSSVVERTCISTIIPYQPATVSLPTIGFGEKLQVGLLVANLCSLVFDAITRTKIGGNHLSFGVFKQLPVIPPVGYCREDTAFILPRMLELVYTAWDIKYFADDVWRDSDVDLRERIILQWNDNRTVTGGHQWNIPDWVNADDNGIEMPPFKWDEERRAVIQADLDAYFARMYGLTRKQLRFILDPHGLSEKELEDILDPWEDPTCAGPDLLPAEPALDFPSETFRVLKESEEKSGAHGCYHTRRLVLDAWARLEAEFGPVQPMNYREMLAKLVPPPSIPTQKVASDFNLCQPDPPQMKLTLELSTPTALPEMPALSPAAIGSLIPGARVRVVGKTGQVIVIEHAGLGDKVTVQLDGERTPRIFLVPPAVMELE